MIGRNMSLQRELIEQRSLLNLLMSHHDSVLSQRLNQRNSSNATADFFNTIGQKRTSGNHCRSESNAPVRGRISLISANSPGLVSTSIEPPCCLTMMSWVMESPRQ